MIGVGVIGCGYWGPNLLRNFTRSPLAEVIGVAEMSPERRAFVERAHPGMKTTSDHRFLLDDPKVQAVVVATPASTHAALCIEALEAGKHVMVEKPMAMNVAEAEAIVACAKRVQKQVLVGHTFVYNPAVLALKDAIDEGSLGEVYYLYGQRLNLGIVRQDVNAMWNLAPHDISIALFLFGESPEAVSATGACYLQPGIEDVVFVNLHFPSGKIAHLHVSWLDPGKVRRMTVVGSKQMVVYDDVAENKLAFYDKGIDRVGIVPAQADGRAPMSQPSDFGLHQLVKRAGDIHLPMINFTEPLASEVEHFLRCVAENKTPRSDAEAGLEVVRVLEAASQSLAAKGATIKLAG